METNISSGLQGLYWGYRVISPLIEAGLLLSTSPVSSKYGMVMFPCSAVSSCSVLLRSCGGADSKVWAKNALASCIVVLFDEDAGSDYRGLHV